MMTGGFSEAELRDAEASAVFESLPALIRGLDKTALGRPGQAALRANRAEASSSSL
jgi:hypothetical protein